MNTTKTKPDSFKETLTRIFESVEDKFRADAVARYVAMAQRQYEAFTKFAAGQEPERDRYYHDSMRVPEYVGNKKGCWQSGWAGIVAAHQNGEWFCDEAKAIKDANHQVDMVKLQFISKHVKKLENATKSHKGKPNHVSGELAHTVLVEGHLKVAYKNGDSFVLTLSMIVNHRYSRGCTSFYQFPSRFKDVMLKGKPVTGTKVSEKWMGEHFQ